MESSIEEVRQMTHRVAKLERENRFWKFGAVLAILVLAVSLAAGVRAQERGNFLRAGTVEAEHFILSNLNGKAMGRITIENGRPVMELYDSNGKVIFSTENRVVAQAR
jgi:hypothetical protein